MNQSDISTPTSESVSTPVAVEFADVVKHYPAGFLGRQRLEAVKGVSFRILEGETFALLGPNRAGKTTLVKVLLSLCRASSGQAKRLGQSTRNRDTLKRIGYVHENPAFPRYLTATELLRYYGALQKISSTKLQVIIPPLLQQVGLADRAHEPISRFSKGMTQRLGMAQALLSDPDLLVLDEPNEGLDLEGRRMVADVIRERKSTGRTTLLVSHVLPEVQQLCDRAGVIVAGRLAFLGSLEELTQQGAEPLETALARLYQANVPNDLLQGVKPS